MTIDSARPAGERVGEDRIRVQIDLDRQANRERWESVTTDTFLYAYRSLSDDELGRYADFLESDEGREYTSVATSALKDVLYEGSEALSRRLASPRHASHR